MFKSILIHQFVKTKVLSSEYRFCLCVLTKFGKYNPNVMLNVQFI